MDLTRARERLDGAANLADLRHALEALRDALGVDHLHCRWADEGGARWACGTLPPAWDARYGALGYGRVDPVVLGCRHRVHPADWRRLDWSGRSARAFRADALAHGVGPQGFCVPVRGPGGLVALLSATDERADPDWAAWVRARQRDLILVAHDLDRRAQALVPALARPRALTPREADALAFLAMGYARGQVAEMLTISEHTLRAYIESARAKLGALNTTHAVARAVGEGLIGGRQDPGGRAPDPRADPRDLVSGPRANGALEPGHASRPAPVAGPGRR